MKFGRYKWKQTNAFTLKYFGQDLLKNFKQYCFNNDLNLQAALLSVVTYIMFTNHDVYCTWTKYYKNGKFNLLVC